MKTVSVRCWTIDDYPTGVTSPVRLYLCFPEGNLGHKLITCLSCGQIYAVDVTAETYVGPPLAEKLVARACIQCREPLAGNVASYPATYIADGQRFICDCPREIPPGEEAIVMKFPAIY